MPERKVAVMAILERTTTVFSVQSFANFLFCVVLSGCANQSTLGSKLLRYTLR